MLGAESLILTIYKEGGSIKMNEYEDCSAKSSEDVIESSTSKTSFAMPIPRIVLPILNADLKKSEGEQAEKESLAIALDFLSSPVSKGTTSKCPVEASISKPKR